MYRCWSFLVGLVLTFSLNAQIERVEPPNWWVGMKNENLQLLVHGKEISQYQPKISYPGVTVTKLFLGHNPNYLFVDLHISPNAEPGVVSLQFEGKNANSFSYAYELKKRKKNPEDYKGFDSSDAIYLITPDRFSNGNPENDVNPSLLETELNRSHDYKRHGGDIEGITNHLDYISHMGFTAIWPCPLLINDMPEQSYHGYAMTDFYEVDPRFGSLEAYRELSEKAAEKGIKLIMDQVANHCGREHWWMKDLPFEDWINFQKEFEAGGAVTNTNHRRTANQDPYASVHDKNLMEAGWFVSAMPDLNQKNPFMANYLIQNSIWWVETLELGGIRQDTYPYPNKGFMSKWAGAIMKEYPNFNIVGEEWSYNPLLVGYWQDGAKNSDNYDANLPTTMDFPLQKAIVEALNEPESWDKGLVKLYEGLANDFYYVNPKSILLFGDNHDMDRIHTQLKQDVSLTKMAMALVLMAPRIPQLYYGTEILMENTEKPGDHGLIRTDFPGGWEGDSVNAFTGQGLTDAQKEMQSYLKTLLHYRKSAPAIHYGATKHFAPEKGVYVLFRYDDHEKLMLVLNKNGESTSLGLSRFNEMDIMGKAARDIISNKDVILQKELILAPRSTTIISIKN